ncbi:MAG TPA: M56 family metallopeptidase, partial [Sediminibacterium sp.]|nr:M56 family metallopeptidase [Sediminibacterium sp.]
MSTLAFYLLEVLLCSSLLMGYYWLVLRNKRFHQYNRFYILLAAIASWSVPLIRIPWSHPVAAADPSVLQMLSELADQHMHMEYKLERAATNWNWQIFIQYAYWVVCIVMLLMLAIALLRLFRLWKTHHHQQLGDVFLVETRTAGAPFSFFRYIFWHRDIDIASSAGQQVFRHELTHVRQKHSLDKLFLQVMLIPGWYNPFFWLMKKEMEMIHEFIADNQSVSEGDTASLAAMLLETAFPGKHLSLANPFFFSPVRRRIQMLTRSKNIRFSYLRRLLILPLLVVFVVLMAFRNADPGTITTISLSSVINRIQQQVIPLTKDTAGMMNPDTLIRKKDSTKSFSLILRTSDTVKKQPLYIIDDVERDSRALKEISPEDIARIDIQKDKSAIKAYGPAAKNGVVRIYTKTYVATPHGDIPANIRIIKDSIPRNNSKNQVLIIPDGFFTPHPLVLLDGKRAELNDIRPDDIDAITVLKDSSARALYGDSGRNGVILIRSKKSKTGAAVFSMSQQAPEFPGGEKAWKYYSLPRLHRAMQYSK